MSQLPPPPRAESDRPLLPTHLTASEVFALTGLGPSQILDLVDAGLLRIEGRGVTSESLTALWRRMWRELTRR